MNIQLLTGYLVLLLLVREAESMRGERDGIPRPASRSDHVLISDSSNPITISAAADNSCGKAPIHNHGKGLFTDDGQGSHAEKWQHPVSGHGQGYM
jgi:hypothetical protein